MIEPRTRLMILGLALVQIATLYLTACSSDSVSGSSQERAPSKSTAASAAAPKQPAAGNNTYLQVLSDTLKNAP